MYQRAIEEVYWSHRIWPEDRLDPKPSLDAVISQAQIEGKVEDYLRKSQLVADQRGSPVTPRELQTEMDRMASHTKQPEVLRELFEALRNDPVVVAECLARPILAERLVGEHMIGRDGPPGRPLCSVQDAARLAVAPYQTTYKLPEIAVATDCTDDTWTATTTVNAPDLREFHTAVWTGSEMIIWGGFNSNGGHVNSLNTGGKYNPITDSWTTTATANAPLGRSGHTAVWTGSEMIIWGGANYPAGPLNSGGRYNPGTDTWTATRTANAPAARHSHTAVWIGNQMIVWGGRDNTSWFSTGGRYNLSTDSWTATSTTSAPSARWDHTALWSGSEMIVWGGTDQTNYLNTGGRYNPSTDNWTPTGLTNVPLGRFAFTAVWTGNEMIAWGGVDQFFNDTSTGGKYNPSTDSWIATSLNSAPSPRDSHSAMWTGGEMVVWAGIFNTTNLNTGGRYNVSTDSWTATSIVNAPLAREDHTAVWTGTEMIAWGGLHYPSPYLNTGGRYCAQPSTPIVQSVVSQKTHGNVGSFGINLPLSGTPGIECRTGGATNDYTLIITFNANVSVNGNPQAAVTSGIGTIGSGGVTNGGIVTISGNVVTVPLTNVTNAQTINVTLFGVNGSTNVVLPMSILIGDTNGNGTVNASDVSQTKSQVGQAVTTSNFREDVNASGTITATDVAIVKSDVGTSLPPYGLEAEESRR